MKKFYVSPKEDATEIGEYSGRFYQFILKEMGYIHIDSRDSIINILTTISSRDHTHIEISISQKKEIEILFTMLGANYKNVSVTMHDAPFIKHPFIEFKNPFLNNISKFFNRHLNSFGGPNALVRKIKSIYVLSQAETEAVKKRYGIKNVHYLPPLDEKIETGTAAGDIHSSMLSNNSRDFIKTIID